MDTTHFTVVAGFEAEALHARTLAEAASHEGFDLPRWQERYDHTIAVEIVETIYGYSLRYASGLQNFGLIAGDLGTLSDALQFTTQWVDSANADRHEPVYFAFIRNTTLADTAKIAERVAARKASIAENARQSALAEHRLGYHLTPATYAARCPECAAAA
jgi:hypothetical protein